MRVTTTLPNLLFTAFVIAGCAPADDARPPAAGDAGIAPQSITIYSGRSESLVGPLLEQFRAESGIEVEVRYGKTAEMAATILEEGRNSPACVFFAQDAGGLGALAGAGRLKPLPAEILDRVDARFRSRKGLWVGASGRARTVVYNTARVLPSDLPDDVFGFTDSKWKGRIGWAPSNGSFQAFVTALRVVDGDDAARRWLEGIQNNDPRVYPKNTPIVAAAGNGEIDIGFVNHYYLYRFLAEQGESFGARNHHLSSGSGALINVAGAGVLDTCQATDEAHRFIEFLLSLGAQSYFAEKTFEYPLVAGVAADESLPPLAQIATPDIDLGELTDLRGTLELLRDVGVL